MLDQVKCSDNCQAGYSCNAQESVQPDATLASAWNSSRAQRWIIVDIPHAVHGPSTNPLSIMMPDELTMDSMLPQRRQMNDRYFFIPSLWRSSRSIGIH